ncbi:MAG: methyltransferase domain-containing protein [Promethearchaeota archaeon]
MHVTENQLGLDIGCGEEKQPNMLGLDCRATPEVDVIADAQALPFRTESIQHVFSSHLIEHFGHTQIPSILSEWVRVIQKGGTIEIRCPDLRARALLFFLNPSWQNIRRIYGGQDYPGNFHKSGFSYGLLKGLLNSCGITKVKRIIKGYKGIPFLPDSLHVKGVKE